MQEGKYVGKLIKSRLAGDEHIEPFKYFDKGSMATIGYKSAVADAFGMKVTGFLAYLMWGFIHVLYLIGWGNRLGTLYTWLRALVFTKNRGHRIITFEQANEQTQDHVAERRNPSAPATADAPPPGQPVRQEAG
jgi:NADH dehydrogenase